MIEKPTDFGGPVSELANRPDLAYRRMAKNGLRIQAADSGAGGGITVIAAALTVTLGAAAACWAVAIDQARGMDMGVAIAIAGLGIVILAAPASVPGLIPATGPMPSM